MFWINKGKGHFRRLGHKIVKDYLSLAWNRNQYINCDYNGFKRNGKMERLLLLEQKSYCCYCMRTLKYKTHTTLEHVLPHNANDNEIKNYYLNFNKTFRKNVRFYLIDKTNESIKIKVPKYPHFCAYENLVLSCDGSIYGSINDLEKSGSRLHQCCNNYRGDTEILPMFFLRHIQRYIIYDEDGEVIPKPSLPESLNGALKNSILNLNLNYHTLVMIRKAWHNIANEIWNVEQINEAIEAPDRRWEIIQTMMLSREYSTNLNHKEYWKLLCQYSYFYKYYKEAQ